MRISIETHFFSNDVSNLEAVRMIKEAGFDCFDLSFTRPMAADNDLLGEDYRERALELRAYADKLGIPCNQAHAPFKLRYDDGISLENEKYVRLVRSIESAAIVGAESIVVHRIVVPDGVDVFEYNRKFYLSLLPYAERFGIRIAVENLFDIDPETKKICGGFLADPKEHAEFVRSLGSPWFIICLDIGHSALTGWAPEDAVRGQDPELCRAVHVHDNDRVADRHVFPMSGIFDWDAVCRAFADMGYRGDMTLEVIGPLAKASLELMPDSLKYSAAVARELVRKIEGFKA